MVTFGMGMAPVESLAKVTATARLAESLGFKYFGHADQRFQGEKDAFLALAADAMATCTITLVHACPIHTLAVPGCSQSRRRRSTSCLAGGPFLALGAGGSGFAEMHLERQHVNVCAA